MVAKKCVNDYTLSVAYKRLHKEVKVNNNNRKGETK